MERREMRKLTVIVEGDNTDLHLSALLEVKNIIEEKSKTAVRGMWVEQVTEADEEKVETLNQARKLNYLQNQHQSGQYETTVK